MDEVANSDGRERELKAESQLEVILQGTVLSLPLLHQKLRTKSVLGAELLSQNQ